MRILADENVPGDIVQALRNTGNDVVWIHEIAPGIADQNVLALAQASDRVLLTFDKDFGELAYRALMQATCGIVLFRLSGLSLADRERLILASLAARDDWAGHFSVVTESRIRVVPLPT